MKVFAIIGSHKKDGRTAQAVQRVMSEFPPGTQQEIVYADELNIHYCTSCRHCSSSECCAQRDDMDMIFNRLMAADLVIIGSPVYFGALSAQLKAICDRLHPAYRGGGVSTLAGKRLMLVFTQDSPCASYADFRMLNEKNLFGFLKFNLEKTIVVGSDGMQVF